MKRVKQLIILYTTTGELRKSSVTKRALGETFNINVLSMKTLFVFKKSTYKFVQMHYAFCQNNTFSFSYKMAIHLPVYINHSTEHYIRKGILPCCKNRMK